MKKKTNRLCGYGLVLWLGISLIFGNVGLRVYGERSRANTLPSNLRELFLVRLLPGQ